MQTKGSTEKGSAFVSLILNSQIIIKSTRLSCTEYASPRLESSVGTGLVSKRPTTLSATANPISAGVGEYFLCV